MLLEEDAHVSFDMCFLAFLALVGCQDPTIDKFQCMTEKTIVVVLKEKSKFHKPNVNIIPERCWGAKIRHQFRLAICLMGWTMPVHVQV